jgi:iron only hydrogenase large subunit-like protein
LTCSGCITSAESVLISQQNLVDIIKALNENKSVDSEARRIFVASVEPQIAASFGHEFNITLSQAYFILSAFLSNIGFDFVFDCSAAQTLSLEESFMEVDEKLKKYENNLKLNVLTTNLPLITGVCPGVVCFIEKKHPSLIPHLLTSPSIQHVQGVLVKYYLPYIINHKRKVVESSKLLNKSSIYHVCISPCHDRKLEALRFRKDLPLENGSGLMLIILLNIIYNIKFL